MEVSDRSRTLVTSLVAQSAELACELGVIEADPLSSVLRRRDAQLRGYFLPVAETPDFKKRHDLECPATVRVAYTAHRTILRVLRRYKATYTGGCRAFWSPEEWIAAGHKAPGPLTALMVIYDGGALPDFFRLGEHTARYEAMRNALSLAGLWAEEITGTCSAIYPAEGS